MHIPSPSPSCSHRTEGGGSTGIFIKGRPTWDDRFSQYGIKVSFWGSGLDFRDSKAGCQDRAVAKAAAIVRLNQVRATMAWTKAAGKRAILPWIWVTWRGS